VFKAESQPSNTYLELEGSGDTSPQCSLNLINNYKTARSPYSDSEIDIKKIKNIIEWQRKQRTAYNTILTGLKIAGKMGKRVRFLTLTTSDLQFNNIDYNDRSLNDSFRKLKQRIQRMTIAKLIQQGYHKPSDVRRYYGDKPLNENFKIDYFKVITNEGNGVVHCVYKGEYLPYNYIVDNWQDIHNSWDINIKLIKTSRKDYKKSACYVVSQYVSNQNSTFQRSSQSWDWIFRGYRKSWINFLNECHQRYFYNSVQRRFYKNKMEVDIFSEWEDSIMNRVKPPPTQIKLNLLCKFKGGDT
jgi:hypothetical protein